MSVRPGSILFKDANASKVYTMDWSEWLVAGAQIASSQWTITAPDGDSTPMTYDNASADGTTASVRLVGGVVGHVYSVMNRITTNETPQQGDDKSFQVRVRQE